MLFNSKNIDLLLFLEQYILLILFILLLFA